MPTLSRLLVPSVCALALLAGAAGVAHCLFDDVFGLKSLGRLLREQERDENIRAADRAALARNGAKEQVIHEVLARRLTLLEAAAAFRRIHQETWDDLRRAGLRSPEDLSDEAMCGNVLYWIKGSLVPPVGPNADAAFLAEMEDEYVRRFGHAPPTRDVPRDGTGAAGS
jgi:hypothetical protein